MLVILAESVKSRCAHHTRAPDRALRWHSRLCPQGKVWPKSGSKPKRKQAKAQCEADRRDHSQRRWTSRECGSRGMSGRQDTAARACTALIGAALGPVTMSAVHSSPSTREKGRWCPPARWSCGPVVGTQWWLDGGIRTGGAPRALCGDGGDGGDGDRRGQRAARRQQCGQRGALLAWRKAAVGGRRRRLVHWVVDGRSKVAVYIYIYMYMYRCGRLAAVAVAGGCMQRPGGRRGGTDSGAQVSGAAPAPHSGSVGLLLLLLLCAAVRRGRRLLPLLPVRFAPPCRVSCRAQTQQRERRSVSYLERMSLGWWWCPDYAA